MIANLQMPGSSPVSFWYSPTFFFKLLNVILTTSKIVFTVTIIIIIIPIVIT